MTREQRKINRLTLAFLAVGFITLGLLVLLEVLVAPTNVMSEPFLILPWVIAGPAMIARAYREGVRDSRSRSG